MIETTTRPVLPAAAEAHPIPLPAHGPTALALGTAAAAAALTACGGGEENIGVNTDAAADTQAQPQAVALAVAAISPTQAARFLGHAAMGVTHELIDKVRTLGYDGWLTEQMGMTSGTRYQWLLDAGFAGDDKTGFAGFDQAMWRKILSSPDTLRQRVALALSEILVVGVQGLPKVAYKAFTAAAYFDLLEENAFGTYRNLLEQVSTSPAMGTFLTFRGNVEASPSGDHVPDENYARELMQLFTIGLYELDLDGTVLRNPPLTGNPIPTYGQTDVTELAKVFTGWDINIKLKPVAGPRPVMKMNNDLHQQGIKVILGTPIPDTPGDETLRNALDVICAEPSLAPFVCKQLIQRLVTSNPSPAYVRAVVTQFNQSGGNLGVAIRAILTHAEAIGDATLASKSFGKLREPMLRFANWARSFDVKPDTAVPRDQWSVGDTSDPAKKLGQSPGRSPSVFNFFRPGYVPPRTLMSDAPVPLVAPEFQGCNESSVIGYVNFMQRVVDLGIGDLEPDYTPLETLAKKTSPRDLLNELNLLLAANQLTKPTIDAMETALRDITLKNNGWTKRVRAALTMVLAAPEFLVQR